MYSAIELRYTRKGSLFEFVSSSGTQAYEALKLDYVEIPILIGYKTKLKKKHLYFESGLAYGQLMNARMKVSEIDPWDPEPKLVQFSDFDLSIISAVKYPLNRNENLFMGIRFSHSLMTTHKLYRLYNMNYGIEIEYLFNQK